jgi:hypothetical protein
MMRTGLPAAVGLAKSRTGGNHRLGPRLNPACIFRPDRRRGSRDARNEHAEADRCFSRTDWLWNFESPQ